jgi:hypothetical protein
LRPITATLYLSPTGYADKMLNGLAEAVMPRPRPPAATVFTNDLRLMLFFMVGHSKVQGRWYFFLLFSTTFPWQEILIARSVFNGMSWLNHQKSNERYGHHSLANQQRLHNQMYPTHHYRNNDVRAVEKG